MLKSLFYSIVLVFSLLPALSYADSITCDGGIVSSGDDAAELMLKCGTPEWKESHQEEITNEINPDRKQRTYITVEEWTYNFGPSQLLRTVTLRNGVVAGFRTGQYGRTKGSYAPGPACDDRIMSVGDTKAEIVLRCGEPFYKSSYQEEQKERIDAFSNRKVIVTVEEWTYNFGPQRFMRIITFRNGTVTDIRTAGYGR